MCYYLEASHIDWQHVWNYTGWFSKKELLGQQKIRSTVFALPPLFKFSFSFMLKIMLLRCFPHSFASWWSLCSSIHQVLRVFKRSTGNIFRTQGKQVLSPERDLPHRWHPGILKGIRTLKLGFAVKHKSQNIFIRAWGFEKMFWYLT